MKNLQNENWTCRTWNIAIKLKNEENEKCTLYDLDTARNTEKLGK
jgi:hypothetical protein